MTFRTSYVTGFDAQPACEDSLFVTSAANQPHQDQADTRQSENGGLGHLPGLFDAGCRVRARAGAER